MNFINALVIIKEQLDYDHYAREILIGQKPADDLPLLNVLVNTVADIYACTDPTICIARKTVATKKVQDTCRKLTPAQCRNIIARARGTQLQTSIQAMQFALLRDTLTLN